MNTDRLGPTLVVTTLLALTLTAAVAGYGLMTLRQPASPSAAASPADTAAVAGPTTPATGAVTPNDTEPAPTVARAAPAKAAVPAPARSAPVRPPAAALPHAQPAATSGGFGCQAALAYLAAHQAPGFVDVCRPHAASGGYGYTCVDHSPQCPGTKVIAIACPAPIVYQNEASNSWVMSGRSRAPIDPYGQNDRRCPPYA
jgi:hypothetical protein